MRIASVQLKNFKRFTDLVIQPDILPDILSGYRIRDAQEGPPPYRQQPPRLRVSAPPREPIPAMSLNESIVEDAALEWSQLRRSGRQETHAEARRTRRKSV